jgi:hypothetical protein
MGRCWLLVVLISALACAGLAQTAPPETLRGKLTQPEGKPPAVETPDHKLVAIDGDVSTRKVLADPRLDGFELEAKGHFTSPGHFLVDPIHTRAIQVRKDGRFKLVTYWCDVCSIRFYAPGLCSCCQGETTLDLRDPDQPDE